MGADPAKPAPDADPGAKGKGKKDEHRDSPREIAETVVFVVVLVLMLKTFVTEAFVIPTGSMAETLYGYQRMVVCDQCDHKFPVNCSSEVDPQDRLRLQYLGCFCPNCQNPIRWDPDKAPAWASGDRVLVAKFLYDRELLWSPRRHEVIVFKFPKEPQKGTTAMNYIKRCEGLAGETLALFDGDVYVTRALSYPHREPTTDPLERWRPENMFAGDDEAVKLFRDSVVRRVDGRPTEGDFRIVRKSPDVMLAMRRIVFDNDHQPRDLTAAGVRRWQSPESGGWTGNSPTAPTVFTHAPRGDATAWLTYNHLLGERHRQRRLEASTDELNQAMAAKLTAGGLKNVAAEPDPNERRRLITNMMGYNTGEAVLAANPRHVNADQNQDAMGHYWVSDLMLDAEVKVESGEGELVLELSKGFDRFRAVFDLGSGECVLQRLTGRTDAERDASKSELARKPTRLKGKGSYRVRFANFDERLTVWVDRGLPFGDGVEYTPAKERGPVAENDLAAPARVGARGANLSVAHLQLWRDTFYTDTGDQQSVELFGMSHRLQTYYVQPGHYLCLGDNSAASADSREWGLVPERLLLGRALWVYFPFWPFNQRFGPIE